MKNFEANYPIEGSSALQIDFEQTLPNSGTIISFPGLCSPDTVKVNFVCQHSTSSTRQSRVWKSFLRAISRVSCTEMALTLRYGSMRGCTYAKVKPWQAAVAGSAFSLLAFASLFIGL